MLGHLIIGRAKLASSSIDVVHLGKTHCAHQAFRRHVREVCLDAPWHGLRWLHHRLTRGMPQK